MRLECATAGGAYTEYPNGRKVCSQPFEVRDILRVPVLNLVNGAPADFAGTACEIILLPSRDVGTCPKSLAEAGFFVLADERLFRGFAVVN
jgi:hypothetical protein